MFIKDLAFFKRIGIFSRHRHIATERNRRDAVFRFTTTVANQFFPESDTERIYLDLVPLRHQKMAQFVDCHQETQANQAEYEHQDITEYGFHCMIM